MKSEIYSHWSREPLVLQPGYRYGWTNSTERGFKPYGLWFDVGGEWHHCAFHQGPEYFRYRNILDIDTSALLRLSTPLEVDVFTEAFAGKEIFPDLEPGIDWARLLGVYKGVLIAPYCWQRSRKLRWYYAWDCASGCIWDFSAIRNVTTEEVPLEPLEQ